jgi:hypothetical protein
MSRFPTQLSAKELRKLTRKVLKPLIQLLSVVVPLCGSAYAQFAPAETYYAVGPSTQFDTMALAGGIDVFGGGPLCGSHHWTQRNPGGANTIAAHDSRTALADQFGDIWIEWNDAAQTNSAGSVVCFYLALESIVAVREYAASGTLVLPAGLVGTPDQNIIPLLRAGEPLPLNIQNILNGRKFNVAHSDIRPEDAKFATMRAFTCAGCQVTGRSATGIGFGAVDFAIDPADTDPITGGPVRRYAEIGLGAAPVIVFANYSNTGSGHFGDPTLAISNINLSIG